MSFEEAERGVANPAYRRSETAAQRVSQQIVALNKAVANIREATEKLGTKADNKAFRTQLKNDREAAHSAAKRIRAEIQELKRQGADATAVRRITKDLAGVVEAFDKVSKQSVIRERQIALQMEASARGLEGRGSMTAAGGAAGSGGGGAGGRRAADELEPDHDLAQMQFTVLTDVDRDLIAERNREAEGIARDAEDLHGMFQDLNTLVHEQGDQLTTIERNVDDAAVHIEKGVEHMEEAKKASTGTRNKIFCLFAIGLIVLAAVLIPVIITVLSK